MSKKKVGIIIGIVAVLAAASVAVWKFGGSMGHDSNDRVYVEKVSIIMGLVGGMQNRYSGIVQPQKTVNINADPDRNIKEFYVEQGDMVEEGDPLFAYDTEDLEMELQQAELEDDNIDLEISNYKKQITELEKERSAASEDSKFEYTTEIQSIQAQIRQAEYEKSSKQLEVEKIQAKIDNSEVESTTAGVVKSLNDPRITGDDGDSDATITIMVTGTYRVKGTLDEQTFSAISPGDDVIIRSRVDETQTWSGTVDNVDTGETVSEESDYDYGDSGDSASKYPFYISLDSADGLILGQHVFIELDQGQTEEKEGLWLYASYIVMGEGESLEELDTEAGFGEEGTGPFVWADDGSGKLVKKPVVLGEYDDMLDEYQILSGLTENDYIAWPMEGLYEGVTTVTDIDDVDYSSSLYQEGTESMWDEDFDSEMDYENWEDGDWDDDDWDDDDWDDDDWDDDDWDDEDGDDEDWDDEDEDEDEDWEDDIYIDTEVYVY